MRPTLPLILCATLAATGCSRFADSRLNPLNWFGASEAAAPIDASGNLRPLVPEGAEGTVVDSRALIASISSLNIDRTPDGAIVRSTGVANTQGQYNAELVPVGFEGGTLNLAFRVAPIAGATQGSSASRQITAAYLIDSNALDGIRTVRVQGAQNSLVSRR